MIDFRYHLVSLVAVFMALAVGIALGAGPLREGISNTLESEVAQLRTERAELRGQLDSSRAADADRDAAVGIVSERVLAGTLTGQRVGVVLLPGADRNALDAVEQQLEVAGGGIALTVEIDAAAEDAGEGSEERAEQDALAEELSTSVDAPASTATETPSVWTVLGASLAGGGAVPPVERGPVLERLETEGLVDLAWRDGDARSSGTTDRTLPATWLVVSGGLSTDEVHEESGSWALAARLDLVSALDELAVPTVVLGEGGGTLVSAGVPGTDPLISAVRGDRRLAQGTSTVDHVESATGQLAAVAAVAWEIQGRSGHYGLATDAQAPVPAPAPQRGPAVPADGPAATAPVPDDASATAP